MKCILLANGDYNRDFKAYQKLISPDDLIICADGGANYAKLMELTPCIIIGDMDSIAMEAKEYFHRKQVSFIEYPRHKDYSDTQLALSIAEERQVKEIIFFGSLGKRLDHTMANIYACLAAVARGIKIVHYSPDMILYIINDKLEIKGQQGDIVSVLALTDEVTGISENGFEYSLSHAVMKKDNPYGISNRMLSEQAEITVEHGILAVFHYANTPISK